MDSLNYRSSILSLLLIIFISVSVVQNNKHEKNHMHHFRPTCLFVFGDSYADTGNSRKGISSAWKAPYGTTFPAKPAGRFSDGRVLTDFVARYLGMKSPEPYRMRKMMKAENMKKGMNFAFGGAGGFDTDIWIPNVSTQIDYLEQLIEHKVYTSADLINSMAPSPSLEMLTPITWPQTVPFRHATLLFDVTDERL